MTPVARDRLLAAACALAQLLSVQPGSHPEPGDLAATAASAVGLAAGVAVTWRRSRPSQVLAVTTAGYVVQAALVGPVVPVALLVACYSVARYGPPVWGPLCGAASVGAVAGFLAVIGDADIAPTYAAALLTALLAGALLAAREAGRRALSREAAAEERLRIARDLHDIVGHGMGAITVQAGAGRMAIEQRQVELAQRALGTIEQASRDMLREVRWLVGLLRDEPDRPGVAQLPALADAARLAGLDVEVRVTGDAGAVSGLAGETAYRLVQEALTNVVRHAHDARHVTVEVLTTDGGTVRVSVRDDGTALGDPSPGHGLAGMRERVEAAHGELVAGPAGDGPGWSVVATLPAQGGSA